MISEKTSITEQMAELRAKPRPKTRSEKIARLALAAALLNRVLEKNAHKIANVRINERGHVDIDVFDENSDIKTL